jgi:4-amino-4-deoxy-L-arabinose transferase-like glycosyltransferase
MHKTLKAETAQPLLPVPQSKSFRARLLVQAQVVFLVATGFLLTLTPSAPFTKELGVCESGAVRDVLAGNIILPRFVPGPIVHVPPLYWWIAAICVKAVGWSELALRLPSLIAAALTCAIVFAWSGRTLGPSVGLWSAVALLLCHFFLDAARQPRMDSMLALFVTAAAVSLERAIAAWAQAKRHAIWYFVAAACAIGLGALTKGILGIMLPGLVVALFLLIRGRFVELFHFDMAATFAAGLAIGLVWFLAGYQLGGRPFLEWQVRMNLWSRFIPAGAGGAGYCAHPFWYFVPQILSGFLPWSLYLPSFALAAWPVGGRRLPEPVVYALCWFIALFIFFSSSHGKCLIYILPAFPPLAILTGWVIAEVQGGFDTRRWVKQLCTAGSAIIAVGTALMVIAAMLVIDCGVPAKIALRLHPTDRRFLELLVRQAFDPLLLLWAGFSLVGAGLIVRGLLRAAPTFETYGTLVIAAAGGWFWFAVMNPALAQGETLKTFARQAAASVPADASISHFGLGDCELNFYSPRPLEPISQISCVEHAAAEQYIIIRKQDFNAIPSMRRACFVTELAATPNDSIGPRLLIRQTRP